jgi:C-terminal processing protease CtpA/Prc
MPRVTFSSLVAFATSFAIGVAAGQQEPQDVKPTAGYVGVAVWPSDFRLVAGVLPNSPAAMAGVREGDYIIAIDRQPTALMAFTEFCERTFGYSGGLIALTVKRVDTGAVEELNLTRVEASQLNPHPSDWAAYVPPLR